MAKYMNSGLGQTSDNTLLSHGLINSNATPRRFRLIDFTFGAAAAAADGTINLQLLRTTTAAGTSTGSNPNPADPADAATLVTGGKTFTVNPTLSTILMLKSVNLRSSYRWFAAPGEEVVVAATQFNGIGFQPISPSPTASNIGLDTVIDE